MKPKKPPYRFVAGRPGDAPPPFVSGVIDDLILLDGDLGAILNGLERAGLTADARRDFASRFFLPLTPRSGRCEDSEEVRGLMLRLNTAGFKFACDPKSPGDPGGIMRALQEQGHLHSSFDEIAWTGPEQWKITTCEMANE